MHVEEEKEEKGKIYIWHRLDIYISWWNFSSNGKHRKSEQK